MRRRDFLWACVSSILRCQSIEISPYHYNVDPAKSTLVRLLPSLPAAIISPSLQKSPPKLPAFLAPDILRRNFPAMSNSGIVVLLFVVFLQSSLIFSQSPKASTTSTPWRTLAGNAPIVIAKGGFSGLVPDSSYYAYSIASLISLPNVIMWCDVQLTKDNVGICAPNVMLDNVTDIQFLFKDNKKSYIINGEHLEGWFSVDYTVKDLSDVHLIQSILSRSDKYDGDLFPILTVEKVAQLVKPPGLWLNVQHDMFFKQHNLSMRNFVHSVSRRVIIDYISSPEVAFLTNIGAMFNRSKTKLVFRFLEPEVTEPSTNQTFGSLLKNLTFLKTFASGILVPKGYIWPVNMDLYLQPHTSLVLDAHKEGLEVFASDFMNDVPLSYNYSYDPLAEILSFIDNTDFSVDGVLSDFPITPSEAIGCFSHINKNSSEYEKPIIISHNGASGMYAGSTDLAYRQAVEDGADVIDCSVQMTKDGIPICLNSINLFDGTAVVQSPFSSHFATIPEIQANAGIFSFNLTWKEIQSLRPAISIPYMHYNLKRNPAYANAGNFMTLSDFLIFSKGKPITGILISIENAAYLAEKQGLGVTDAVFSALKHAGYDNQAALEVTIQSTDSAVLKKLKQQTDFKLMYMVDESIRDALNSSLKAIKQFADSVAINKE
ncbi:glycerophosphodiester phosphodiesterase GDPDL4-like isoform X2 [Magnolia sinica]|uniref:glycerophosphodiester phosphodiesterase GDPDL4-like isoform X2 n=1 Tax=Magnolia sinica TaxID=86752 RepID=UPI002658F2DA|nr:glycerophosphodiester phosphodiesterase GDPDL4-like isoform X2 [Magnolia sinica]